MNECVYQSLVMFMRGDAGSDFWYGAIGQAQKCQKTMGCSDHLVIELSSKILSNDNGFLSFL